MRHRFTLILGILVMACLAFVPAVAAFDAAVTSPATDRNVYNGDTITVVLTGLSDGDVLTYRLTSAGLAPSSNSINLGTLTMPFDFKNGLSQSTMTTTGLTAGTYSFTVTKDGGASMSKTDSAGTGTISSAYNIKHGSYVIQVSGVPTAGDRSVSLDYNVTGTVDGGSYAIPPQASLAFALTDLQGTGSLRLQVLQGSTVKLDKTFTVAPVPTPVPTAPPSGDTGGGGQQSQQGQQQAAPQQQAQLGPVQQAVTNVISNLVSTGAITTTTLSGGATTSVVTLDVGTATIGGGSLGSVSLGAGTLVISAAGSPVSSVGAGVIDISNYAGTGTESFGITGSNIGTLDFSSLFGSGGTSFNFFA